MDPFLWLILKIIDLFVFFVIASVIMSWLVAFEVINLRNRLVYMIYDMLYRVTEPALRPIRRFMPNLGGIDLSPLILLLLLVFVERLLLQYWPR